MKALYIGALSLFTILLIAGVCLPQTGERERSSFNGDWRFTRDDPADAGEKLKYTALKDKLLAAASKTDPGLERISEDLAADVSYATAGFDDSSWRKLDLPHDWAIEGDFIQDLPGETGKRPFEGVGWYRKDFTISAADNNKQIYVDFDGAMAYPEVWLNGQLVGGWAYGYSSFRIDLTRGIRFGKDNVLAVRLYNPPRSSRWYPGSGIYRNVWLVKTPSVHIGFRGTYITTTEISRQSANTHLKTTIDNDLQRDERVSVRVSIYDGSTTGGKARPTAASTSSAINIGTHSSKVIETDIRIPKPKLWSIDSPNQYVAEIEVLQNGKPVDVYRTQFGIRDIKYNAQQGFLLNGKRVYLKGVCDHHDLGALGSALSKRALERQLEILKEMGVNAIRTSHNPPAPELLDLADKMGFVVMDEGFDMWVAAKKENDYHIAFPDWHELDWRAQIRRDRNHPSVILWSIGNEIREQRNADGHKIAAELTSIAHEEDPTRPTIAAANNTNAGYNGFQKTVGVFGYNYKPNEYAKFRASNPDMSILASETASTVSSRGEYFFPVEEDKSKGRQNFQMSSYDLYAPSWATPPDTEFEAQDRNPFVGGEFVWTGFDYLGEPTPYDSDAKTLLNFTDPVEQAKAVKDLKDLGKIVVPSRSSYFGIVDLCGFKKDRFFIYQARWRPDLPMAHILPHWNWPERVGQVTPVHVYTSGDEAELFLNGRSLGRKKRGAFEYRLRWDDVKYEPGELRVVAYRRGKRWAEDVVRTTTEPYQLTMQADRASIDADGNDLSFVTIAIADKARLTVPRSKNRLKLQISGPGEIVAMDNGDATDLESFQSTSRKAYNGLALVIVRAKKRVAGNIRLRVSSDGLKSAEITIRSRL